MGRLIAFSLLLFAAACVSGCTRYDSKVLHWRYISEGGRQCYYSCKMRSAQCRAGCGDTVHYFPGGTGSGLGFSSSPQCHSQCDLVEHYCYEKCPDVIQKMEYEREKWEREMIRKCGLPPPGVDKQIYRKWCERGLV